MYRKNLFFAKHFPYANLLFYLILNDNAFFYRTCSNLAKKPPRGDVVVSWLSLLHISRIFFDFISGEGNPPQNTQFLRKSMHKSHIIIKKPVKVSMNQSYEKMHKCRNPFRPDTRRRLKIN